MRSGPESRQVQRLCRRPRIPDARQLSPVGSNGTPAVAQLYHGHATPAHGEGQLRECAPGSADHDDGIPAVDDHAVARLPETGGDRDAQVRPSTGTGTVGLGQHPDHEPVVGPGARRHRCHHPAVAAADHHGTALREQPAEFVRECPLPLIALAETDPLVIDQPGARPAPMPFDRGVMTRPDLIEAIGSDGRSLRRCLYGYGYENHDAR